MTKNRWLIAASAVGIHVSIGSIYAYSVWKMPLENTFGWTAKNTTVAFSIAIFFLGISAAFLGRFIEKKGPSKGGLLSAAFFCTGLLGSALACWLENLYLFYLFFGVVSGIGLGLGYIAPVSTLVKWFPDRRGLATGLAIMGFGFGGLICGKLIDVFNPKKDEIVLPARVSIYEHNKLAAADPAKAEEALKHVIDIPGGVETYDDLVALKKSGREEDKRLVKNHPGLGEFLKLKEANPGLASLVTAEVPTLGEYKKQVRHCNELFRNQETDSEEYLHFNAVKKIYKSSLVYEKANVVKAFVFLGIIYLVIMVPSALYISPPPAAHTDKFAREADKEKAKAHNPAGEMTAVQAIRTPGFYGLWLMLFINVSCGIAVIATAKKMGYEMVRMPDSMSLLLVMGISLFNGLGRIIWASFSDYIGRANTYITFFAIQIVAFPALAHLTSIPIAFMVVTFLVLTCYGGGFASIPAYISDLFGLKEMPTIHGFILTAWSVAGIVGPMINAYVYEKTGSYQQSLYVFGGAFVVALAIAVLMHFEIKRMRRFYSQQEVERSRKHVHGV